MGLLDTVEREAAESRHAGIDFPEATATSLFGGRPTASGVNISNNRAREFSPWYAGVNFSASHLGTLPLKLMEQQADGGAVEVTTHPVSDAVKTMPNSRMQAVSFREALQGHLLTRGNAYAEIVKNGRGQTAELWPLDPDATQLITSGDEWFYQTAVELPNADRSARIDFDRVLHIPGLGPGGIEGWSVFRIARETLARGLAQDLYSSRFFSGDGQPRGALVTDGKLSPDAKKTLKKGWREAYGGTSESFRVAVLEAGVNWEQIGVSPEDAEIVSQLEWSAREVANFLGLPEHVVGVRTDATQSDVEQQMREAVKNHLRPWAKRWENALDVQLLSDRERRQRGLHFKFNLSALLRGDSEARADLYETLVSVGSMTPNEVRDKEDMNPLDQEGADEPWVQMQDIPMSIAQQTSPAQRALLKAASEGDVELAEQAVRFREIEAKDRQDNSTDDGTTVPEPSQDEARQDPPDLPAPVRERRRITNMGQEMLERDFGRMIRAEVQEIRSELGRMFAPDGDGLDEFEEFLTFMYGTGPDDTGEIGGIIERTVEPTMRSYARTMADAAAEQVGEEDVPEMTLERFLSGEDGSGGYIGTYRTRYAAMSRGRLLNVARDAAEETRQDEDEDLPPERRAIERELDRWLEGEDARPRNEQQADWEANRLGNATALAIFAAAGVTLKRWTAVGSNCPACEQLNGTVIGIRETFLGQDDAIDVEGLDQPMRAVSDIGHPPLHRGCDCIVVTE